MAEWVQKGNLKGPQGDPGQDAQLPAGGTEGQVLTKTADGEAWADVPQPDMTGVVKTGTIHSGETDYPALSANGAALEDITIGTEDGASAIGPHGISVFTADSSVSASLSYDGVTASYSGCTFTASTSGGVVSITSDGHIVAFSVRGSKASIQLDSKTVTSITDDASSGSSSALATAKAVKDYVDDHAMPSVVPISRGGTGATTAEGAALMVFAHAPEASPTQAGVVKTLSDQDFCEYMGIDYNPEDWS